MRDEDFYRAVGARLRRRRRLLELTQGQVAARCGLTFQQIQKYEAGQVAIPIGRMVALARVLEAPLSTFVDEGAVALHLEPFKLKAAAQSSATA
jgi:transcriptional regulator with XRE-family HTH domain